jgi:hypothetical protein
MSADEAKAEAVRLIDTFGPWTGGREWWAHAGYPDPPRELVEAVKFEGLQRQIAADPDWNKGVPHIHVRPK